MTTSRFIILAISIAVTAAIVWYLVTNDIQAGSTHTSSGADGLVREVSSTESDILHNAQQLLIRDCMRQRGFDYWVVPLEHIPDYRTFTYVVDDLAWARRHGYGSDLQRTVDQAMRSDPNQRYVDSLPPAGRSAALAALNGTPRDPALEATLPTGGTVRRSALSCVSSAERTLYGDLATWYRASRVTDDFAGPRYAMVVRDPRYVTATTAWSVCMHRAGYPYATPAEARNAQTQQNQTTARQQEIDVAMAEASCANSSQLAYVAHELDRQYNQVLLDRYHTDVASKRRLELNAVPKAQAIVGAT